MQGSRLSNKSSFSFLRFSIEDEAVAIQIMIKLCEIAGGQKEIVHINKQPSGRKTRQMCQLPGPVYFHLSRGSLFVASSDCPMVSV